MIKLSNELKQQMFDYALSVPDKEVCGLIGSRSGGLDTFYPVKNIASQPAREFLMDPGEQVDAMRTMRNEGETMKGIFHSHPDAAAQPSENDLRLAYYPDMIYLILSLQTARPELKAWYFDGTEFKPEFIEYSGSEMD